MKYTENQSWIIEYGDTVLKRKASQGDGALADIDQLVYCMWFADYGMRNAGEVAAAYDVDGRFHLNGAVLAKKLGLPESRKLFGLPPSEFQSEYFGRFECVCEEPKIEVLRRT